MKKQIYKLTESDLHRIIESTVIQYINETDCGSAMQSGVGNNAGGSNPSAGQYDVPFLSDKPTKKRTGDFKKGTMTTQHTFDEGTDVINKKIYSPKN